MAYKKKYKKGKPIKTLHEVVVLFNSKDFIWTHGKAYHYGWWGSWSIHFLSGQISRGMIFSAAKL